jgi:hypothetical protein
MFGLLSVATGAALAATKALTQVAAQHIPPVDERLLPVSGDEIDDLVNAQLARGRIDKS